MLDFDLITPHEAQDGAPLVVLLHGRGSHKGDLTGLASRLPPGALVITPQAPFPGSPWGYGAGWAWYRYLGDDRVESETLQTSLKALGEFLRELPARLPVTPGPLVLGGFSQGGTMSIAFSLTHPGEVAGVVNFSGFLVADDSVPVDPESARACPIFWGHGTMDPAVPHSLAVRGRARLSSAGANVTARDYPIGHWISPQEAADVSAWMTENALSTESRGQSHSR